MDPLGTHPLIRSFERHLYAENRSSRTVITYLIAVRQADTFLRARGSSLEAATRADLEAFLGDLLSRRKASTAATYHKVLKILYAREINDELDRHKNDPPAKKNAAFKGYFLRAKLLPPHKDIPELYGEK